MSGDLRSVLHSQDRQYPPGRLADVKRDQASDPGSPQPQAAERFIDWAKQVHHAAAYRAGAPENSRFVPSAAGHR
jgi:hypothetical protein